MEKQGRIEILGLNLEELAALLQERGWPSYRAKQIYNWVYVQKVDQISAMANLPNDLRQELAEKWSIWPLFLRKEAVSSDGTHKYLLELGDGKTIETVAIPEKNRLTVCVSTQVGCAMNCSFCATGRAGFVRNLSVAEVVAQVLFTSICLGREVSNVVYMGMGEPFNNYDNAMSSLRILSNSAGLNIGMRRITISTCGIVPMIYRYADEGIQAGLAVSLHAATDAKRQAIMPINKRFPLAELLDSCRYYVQNTRRRISFEYALIQGFNDSKEDLEALCGLLGGLLCHVNVIPVNPVDSGLIKPDEQKTRWFVGQLERRGIPASLRRERGADIKAACGQLRQTEGEDTRDGSPKSNRRKS